MGILERLAEFLRGKDFSSSEQAGAQISTDKGRRFLDRYRESLVVQQQTAQELLTKQVAEEKRLREVATIKEQVSREHHLQRRQQAENFHQESGLATVMAEFDTLLTTDKISGMLPATVDSEGIIMVGPRPGFVPRGHVDKARYASEFAVGHLRPKEVDEDSILDIARWDRKERKEGPFREYLRADSTKYLIVETQPAGDIIFYSSNRMVIPLSNWRQNKSVFDAALEQAFNTPRIDINKYPAPGSRGMTPGQPGFHGPVGNG